MIVNTETGHLTDTMGKPLKLQATLKVLDACRKTLDLHIESNFALDQEIDEYYNDRKKFQS